MKVKELADLDKAAEEVVESIWSIHRSYLLFTKKLTESSRKKRNCLTDIYNILKKPPNS